MEPDISLKPSEPLTVTMLESIKVSMERLVEEVSDMVEMLEVLQQDSIANIQEMI